MANAALEAYAACLGPEVTERIAKAKILVVGAGGIGCELLKNLVLSGFKHIHVIDLDTIDVSNLNRQFLFRRSHVGKSKAMIAKEAVLGMRSDVDITAHHANIKDAKYDSTFFSSFDLILNALDNLEARRHVNRLCLAAKVVLIESGTQGYTGQVQQIRHGYTECFECQPMKTPQTYAVCTIRNTPDKPIHCIVWAKYIYATLFGPPDEDNIMADAKIDYKQVDGPPFEHRVFDYFFTDEIRKQCEVVDRWKGRQPPTPLDRESLLIQLPSDSSLDASTWQRTWTVAENVHVLLRTIRTILERRKDELGDLSFDKDDDLAMDFVTAAANLRMNNFGIPMASRFEIKGIAGNIVHAIATTNAIAAGLIVMEAFKILSNRPEEGRLCWIARQGPLILNPQRLDKPNPSCYVCGKPNLQLTVNTNVFTLKHLYDRVLKKRLGFNEPSIDVISNDNAIGLEEDHDTTYLSHPLSHTAVRLTSGALMAVEDYSQHYECSITINHSSDIDPDENPDEFILSGETKGPQATTSTDTSKDEAKEAPPTSTPSTTAATSVEDDDDLIVSLAPIHITSSSTSTSTSTSSSTDSTHKRKDLSSISSPPHLQTKRARTDQHDDAIEID